jgi:large subunit ribosomal protein L17
MRHRVQNKKLSRDKDARKSLLKVLATDLIEHGSIETTLVKAKFVRPYIEKLITRSKEKNFTTVKYAKTKLTKDSATRKLLDEIAPKFKDRKGGYTRVIKTRYRLGDRAKMAKIEFIE